MRAGAEGCEFAVHAAATLGDWGEPEEFERGNVIGTENALRACADAGVRRFVHVGTEAALMAGQPLVNVDETAPLRPDSPALYSATKARAEQAVRAANREGFETVVIRPRFVWGTGDTTLLPSIVELVQSGRFAWIGGGRHLHLHHPRRQHRRGPGARGPARAPGRGLLRHRRGPGRVPRVRHAAARDPGRGGALAHAPQRARGSARHASARWPGATCRCPVARRSRASPTGSPRRSARSGSTRPARSSATRRGRASPTGSSELREAAGA